MQKIIYLNQMFPSGTLGHEMEYRLPSLFDFQGTLRDNLVYMNPKIMRNLRQGLPEEVFIEQDPDYEPVSPKKTRRLERALAQLGRLQDEEPNSDELLRRQGFYDSTDKRSCINNKRR